MIQVLIWVFIALSIASSLFTIWSGKQTIRAAKQDLDEPTGGSGGSGRSTSVAPDHRAGGAT